MFCCLVTSRPDVALAVARACSPRVRVYGPGAVFDVSGCSQTIGPAATIGSEVLALAKRGSEVPRVPGFQGSKVPRIEDSSRTLEPWNPGTLELWVPRVAVAPTVTMAWLLAHARSGMTVAMDAALLSALPVGWLGALKDLEPSNPRTLGPSNHREITEVLAIFERWGLRTLGDVAALPRGDVLARLGPLGRRLHQAASGEDAVPFVPMDETPVFADRMELEWPIEGLEPLAFVLARSCERLSLALQRADRGAVTVRTQLRLVTRETHERTLNLPAPMADARILRTLILLDLESHPPPAAIDIVTIELDVSPGPIVQGSLILPTLPTSEDLATLVARLTALVGGSRVGAPAVLDTHDARAVGMGIFEATGQGKRQKADGKGASDFCPLPFAFRRFRIPIAASVTVEHRVPVSVQPSARGLSGGRVVACAGPWRSSGGWWTFHRAEWDRDEWDIELATGDVYRIARDRSSDQWVVEGILD
jgi:hypothetical protein